MVGSKCLAVFVLIPCQCLGAPGREVIDSLVCAPEIQSVLLLSLQAFRECRVPRTVRVGEHHSLDTDVLVQPDRPADPILSIDSELLGKRLISARIDRLEIGTIRLGSSVHDPKLPVPDRCVGGFGVHCLSLVSLADLLAVLVCASIDGTIGEPVAKRLVRSRSIWMSISIIHISLT
jgi:hypothetical protein